MKGQHLGTDFGVDRFSPLAVIASAFPILRETLSKKSNSCLPPGSNFGEAQTLLAFSCSSIQLSEDRFALGSNFDGARVPIFRIHAIFTL